MKKTLLYIALAATMAVSCSKSELTPPKPGEETMTLNKSSVSLEYLKRDTLKVTTPGVDQSKIEWSLYPEDTKVAVLVKGNIIVARKKGTCQVIGRSADGKVASCTVNVTTEEYVQLSEILIEYNGKIYCKADTIYYNPCQVTEFKVVGYKPDNATHPVIRKTEIFDSRNEANNIGNRTRWPGSEGSFWGYANYIENKDISNMKGCIGKDEINYKFIFPQNVYRGSFYYFKFLPKAFPDDILLTEEEEEFKLDMEVRDYCQYEINPYMDKTGIWGGVGDYDYIASKHKMNVNSGMLKTQNE